MSKLWKNCHTAFVQFLYLVMRISCCVSRWHTPLCLELHTEADSSFQLSLGPVHLQQNHHILYYWTFILWVFSYLTGYKFLVNDQRDAQISFYVLISIYNSLHVSSTSCSSSGETNCINTTSGNSHSVLVAEMCAGWKNLPTCTHLGHQHRMTVTRGCIDTVCLSWWWARRARNM